MDGSSSGILVMLWCGKVTHGVDVFLTGNGRVKFRVEHEFEVCIVKLLSQTAVICSHILSCMTMT